MRKRKPKLTYKRLKIVVRWWIGTTIRGWKRKFKSWRKRRALNRIIKTAYKYFPETILHIPDLHVYLFLWADDMREDFENKAVRYLARAVDEYETRGTRPTTPPDNAGGI